MTKSVIWMLGILSFLLVAGAAEARQETQPPTAHERTKVIVGGYEFEPFVEADGGIAPAFIALLNAHQKKYQFEFLSIPAQRRYDLMQRGAIDALFFEMPRWGWQEMESQIETTRPILLAAEAFYAFKSRAQNGDVFTNLSSRKLALTLGYHYAFVDFNADQDYIRSRYDAVFANSQREGLRRLVAGSVDLAIMSDVFLHREFVRDPALKGQMVRAPKVDQLYMLPLMARKGGPVSAAELENMLGQLKDCACLKPFFASYGIADMLIYQGPAKP